MHRLLGRPGGILLLSTPQRWSPDGDGGEGAFLPGVREISRRIYGEAIFDMGTYQYE